MKLHKRITIETLLRTGTSQREITRVTGGDRKTIRGYARAVNSSGVAIGVEADEAQTPPPRPPALSAVARSAGECHRDWIAQQVALGRNAQSIYQDVVERVAFTHHYNSVKRFVLKLKARAPERFDVLASLPGEEAQVD